MREEKQKLIESIYLPLLGVAVLWLIHLVQFIGGWNFAWLGVYPGKISALSGIITGPFIHSTLDYAAPGHFSWNHLVSNSLPFLILSTGIIYFYRSLSLPVLITSWLLPGLCVWIAGRASYHIGISGMIYAMAFFLFFSGVFRKDRAAMALSLIVSFLYGSMVWGIFPLAGKGHISWEGHLFGAITGIALAFIYRKKGPQPRKYVWENEPDIANEESFEPWNYQKNFPPPEGFEHPGGGQREK